MKRLLTFASCVLCSCAELHQASFDRTFANAVIRNNTQAVYGNCTARNAVFPLNGLPPIYYAASYGNEDVIDLLYNHGASLQARSQQGKSLVYAAAANGHDQTARKLVVLKAGPASDLARGAAAYQQKKAAEAEARILQAAALTWLVAAVASDIGGSSSGGADQSHQTDIYKGLKEDQDREDRASQIQENKEARMNNELSPHPWVPDH